MGMDVLEVDKSGQPRNWLNYNDAVKAYAEDRIICDLGHVARIYTGGKNWNGDLSKIEISSIIMTTGPVLGGEHRTRVTKFCERAIMYARDCNMCAYCGIVYKDEEYLTIDHVIPRAQGGKHYWTNTVTACASCNHGKADRTPEEAGMQLLYVPYAPEHQEKLLLKNKKVLADQMEYLLASIPKTSRVWSNPAYRKH
jgi:HNH endonuclease